jgi:hypothetical protein
VHNAWCGHARYELGGHKRRIHTRKNNVTFQTQHPPGSPPADSGTGGTGGAGGAGGAASVGGCVL